MPADPFTELGAGTVAMHEMYCELLAAGFTRGEALYLVAATLRAPEPPKDGDDA